MTQYPIIQNPEFVDLQKTSVRMTLIQEDGSKSIALLNVPQDQARGVNTIWDRILDEHDVEAMRRNRNNLESRIRREAEFNDKKKKAVFENEKLRILFDSKMSAFNYPFVSNATNEEKAAVRRASNLQLLNIILTNLATKYMQEKNFSLIDLIDEIDDIEYEREQAAAAVAAAAEAPAEPETVEEPAVEEDSTDTAA